MRYELVMVAMQLAAFWPVWRWVALRAAGSPQGWLCVVPLAGAVAFAWRGGRRAACARPGLGLPAAIAVLYAVTFAFVPPIVRAFLAATAVACTLSRLRLGRRLHPGIWALCVLSLPVMPTAQFLLGWPMRQASTRMVAGLLRLTGLPVSPEGACLRWGSRLIAVDAPCSGVRMLWAGLCLVFLLACFHRLSAGRTLAAAAAAVAAVLVGNTLRASSLFFLEAGITPTRAGLHAGVGVVAFAMTAGLIAWSARRICGRRVCEPACT